MPRSAFTARVGATTAASDARQADSRLIALLVERGFGAPGRCVVELDDPLAPPARPGDAVTVELDAGDGVAKTVFTGTVYASEATAKGRTARAADALADIAARRVQGAYEGVTSDFVAKDVIGKCGATAGDLAPGPSLAAYALHPAPRALHHLATLAALAGAEVWADGAGKVHAGAPKSGAADHAFSFGVDVLALELRLAPPAADGVEVWGEGAASAEGSDAASWVATDLAGVSAKASLGADGAARAGQAGERGAAFADGALREGQAAKDSAKAWAAAAAARRVRGHMEVEGRPGVEPNDLVAVERLPDTHACAKLLDGKPLRVRRVRHTLDAARGFRTRLEF